MDKITIILLAVFLVLPWIILIIFLLSSNKKTVSNYKKLEEKYGIKSDYSKKVGMKNHPSGYGTYRNRNIKIESIIRDSVDGKKVAPHTCLIVECNNPDNFTFSVVRRKKQNAASFLNGSTLLNDNEFDDKYIIQTNNPEKTKNLFDFNTKFKLDQVHMLGFNGIIKLEGNHLIYIEKGLLSNDSSLMRLELVMHELCDIADVMKYN
jgi:hypothetical protein